MAFLLPQVTLIEGQDFAPAERLQIRNITYIQTFVCTGYTCESGIKRSVLFFGLMNTTLL